MNLRNHALLAAGLAGALTAGLPAHGVGATPTATAPADDAVRVIGRLGGDLHGALSSSLDDPNANFVFSPASVGIALTMVAAGAGGTTADQIEDFLGFTDPSIHESMTTLVSALTGTGSESATMLIANSLWAQEGLSMASAFEETLRDDYGSELELADFIGNPAGAVDAVNEWVADNTADRIPTLLTDAQVTDLTRFIVVNAVYLDAEWASPFDPQSTASDQFTRGDGSTVATDFMFQNLDALYGEHGGLQTVVLPYLGGYEMVVVLPIDGGVAEFEQTLGDVEGDLDVAIGPLTSTDVDLSLPKWDIAAAADLIDPLEALGLRLPFDPDQADFTEVTTDEPLFLSAVAHQANITIDEAGTEAAAATAIVGTAGAAPGPAPEPVEMDVNSPFFFAIRHAGTGAVVFQGHVNDPTAG